MIREDNDIQVLTANGMSTDVIRYITTFPLELMNDPREVCDGASLGAIADRPM